MQNFQNVAKWNINRTKSDIKGFSKDVFSNKNVENLNPKLMTRRFDK